MTDEKTGQSAETTAADRDAGGRFARGNPGRPRGSKHAALQLLDQIGADNAETVMRKVCELAKGGDMRAAELVLKRLWPERKGRPVPFAMPEVREPRDVVAAIAAVTQAVADGDLSPEEGQAVAAVLETQRRVIETAELERRIAALEGKGAI